MISTDNNASRSPACCGRRTSNCCMRWQ